MELHLRDEISNLVFFYISIHKHSVLLSQRWKVGFHLMIPPSIPYWTHKTLLLAPSTIVSIHHSQKLITSLPHQNPLFRRSCVPVNNKHWDVSRVMRKARHTGTAHKIKMILSFSWERHNGQAGWNYASFGENGGPQSWMWNHLDSEWGYKENL